MSQQPDRDIDEQLEALKAKESEFTRLCMFESANRVANEIRRLARAERRFVPYLKATFTIMNNAGDRLDPQTRRDAAIEVIGLLESNELARSIQPDLPEQEYEWAVHWYSSCGYDNLASATAELNGHNSDGIHACISEGIEVCRRTGKTQCITCFREYATNVYRTADDPDMALHYARVGMATDNRESHDRRWASVTDVMEILSTRGELAATADLADTAIEFAENWHSPIRARLITKHLLTEIAYLLGDPQRWETQCQQAAPPKGEFLSYELTCDHTQAMIECIAGDFDAAIKRLTHWDQQLTRRQCLEQWTGTRLRLLAAHRMAGHHSEFERLADQLQRKSQAARDWQSLSCLKHMRDEAWIPVPVAITHHLDVGPFAAPKSTNTGPTNTTASASATIEEASADEPVSGDDFVDEFGDDFADEELPAVIANFHARLEKLLADDAPTGEEEDSLEQLVTDLLAINPAEAGPKDQKTVRQWALFTISHLVLQTERPNEIWDWAGAQLAGQRQDAVTLSLYARLGFILLYNCPEQMSGKINETQLEGWFRESLDLDSDSASNFGRAGDFFLYLDNLGDAERCYARGWRLDRGDAELASKLARIYRQTERERDALAVLDMTIRSGTEDPNLLWEAAISAQALGQQEATLTYLQAFDDLVPDQPWVNYYRTNALLELQRFPEARTAVEREAELNPSSPFPVLVQRAAIAAGTEQMAELRPLLTEVLALPLSSIDYMTPSGIAKVLAILWQSASALPSDDPLRGLVIERLVSSSLAPDALFEQHRVGGEPLENVNFYRCTIEQPLDERWLSWPGRLVGEEELTSYQATWGVLARSESEAATCVMEWQTKCFPLDASVTEMELVAEGYTDHVGVVWQRFRASS
jgi:tetratricopeptide (TPR) repeat protein